LGANAFFCAFFGICAFLQFVFGLRWKTWTFMIALVFGCIAECLGYVGRIMLHSNPWSNNAFDIQICCLIIAPAFVAAGIYLTLKHIILETGSSSSRLQPRMYTWTFILADLFSLVLQGAGGGIAATANHGSNMQVVGNNLMMTGIVWQVFTLLLFGFLVTDYYLRARKEQLSTSAIKLTQTLRFKLFVGGLVLAYLTVFTRCIFRIGEMAKGWGNPIMQSESDFIGLDGVMITIAVLCLTAFHPGFTFPEMQQHGKTSPVGELGVAEREKVHDSESPPTSIEQARSKPKKGMFGRSKK
ncbi:hypothetical protein P7C71_g3443, partial [Lecanoromycetidae sp. Uapishka_2]